MLCSFFRSITQLIFHINNWSACCSAQGANYSFRPTKRISGGSQKKNDLYTKKWNIQWLTTSHRWSRRTLSLFPGTHPSRSSLSHSPSSRSFINAVLQRSPSPSPCPLRHCLALPSRSSRRPYASTLMLQLGCDSCIGGGWMRCRGDSQEANTMLATTLDGMQLGCRGGEGGARGSPNTKVVDEFEKRVIRMNPICILFPSILLFHQRFFLPFDLVNCIEFFLPLGAPWMTATLVKADNLSLLCSWFLLIFAG